jgi:hypothetical protein
MIDHLQIWCTTTRWLWSRLGACSNALLWLEQHSQNITFSTWPTQDCTMMISGGHRSASDGFRVKIPNPRWPTGEKIIPITVHFLHSVWSVSVNSVCRLFGWVGTVWMWASNAKEQKIKKIQLQKIQLFRIFHTEQNIEQHSHNFTNHNYISCSTKDNLSITSQLHP